MFRKRWQCGPWVCYKLCCFAIIYFAPTLESRKWRNGLHFFKTNPSMYSYHFFQSQCAVYVKLPFHDPDSSHFGYTQHGHVYVGSTAVSVAKRNFNRQAKFKQLRNGQAVHAELSCSSSGNFNIYNTVVLETHTIYDHAWVREHCLISCWQPALNHQFILKYLKVNSWRMEVPALNPTIPLRSNSAHDYFKGWDDAWPP